METIITLDHWFIVQFLGKGFDNELAFGEYFITTHMEVQNIKTQKLQENSLLGNNLSTVFTKNAKNVGYNSNFPSANQLMHYSVNKKATTITLTARKFKSSSQNARRLNYHLDPVKKNLSHVPFVKRS